MRTIMVLLLLLLGIVPAHGATDCEPPDCPVVVDAIDGPVHETADSYTAALKLRHGPAQQNVEVSYRFVDGTAKLGEDYQAVPRGPVTIKAGESQAGVPYKVLRVTGEQKKFTLEITSVKPGQIGKRVAVFTIGGKR
ncbi:Calx-beta domain-containing protein [Lentzea albidocapillata subsp. violacea]|uniref:Calx-beta domain-containing protein n=1 Tax=Lentzea albidocapillata subsp. violacea TaxID=128104 RepID=A0A1G8UII2_9PSEU|nr:Calx-beta domain-containing protein [Lentzea albidocapillata]SDJ53444.1 Calx-beta domain-containing protein [Lentzea albidocapillata subsp. violacea]